ncbi:MAG: transglycosylase domain-containing protein [Myxococcota bacterium]
MSHPDREDVRLARRRRRWLRWARWLLVGLCATAAVGFFALWLVLRHFERDLPSTRDLRNYRPPQVTRVVARDGTPLAELFVERRTVVPIEQIPKSMKLAVLAAEDADFYRHEGLDYLGMLRALYVNLRSARARQGGSTITQQVIKNVLLTPERTYERKAREVLLARRIEQHMSKDEILELYLNHIFFGHGRFGVEEAARYYFGKGIAEVTLAEAALIAGLAKGPSLYSPRVDLARSQRRRDLVLQQMAEKGFALPSVVADATAEPVALAPAPETLSELAPETVAEVERQLTALVGAEAKRGGYTVETTIDPQLQALARRAVQENLDAYAARHGAVGPLSRRKKAPPPFQGTPEPGRHRIYRAVVRGHDDAHGMLLVQVGTVAGFIPLSSALRYNPKRLPPSQFAPEGRVVRVSPVLDRDVGPDGLPRRYRLELGPQSALVALDAETTEIRALVGGYEAVRGVFDRATSAHRQVGSTFKPLVYSYGLHTRQLTPASPVADFLSQSQADAEAPERPAARLLLREALARSVNEAATWSLETLGAEPVVGWTRQLGATSTMKPTPSLALGAYEMYPRELASVYATFASGGMARPPVLIRRILDAEGRELDLARRAPGKRVMSAGVAFLTTDLLRSVIAQGTARAARSLPFEVAGKTGTSNDARDAWFAGYSSELVAVVWTGFDDNVPLGGGEYGAKAALPAWVAFMRGAHAQRVPPPLARPADGTGSAGDIIELEIDARTGLLPFDGQERETKVERFLSGTEPTERAEAPPAEDPGDIYDDLDAPLPAPPPDGSSRQEESTPLRQAQR